MARSGFSRALGFIALASVCLLSACTDLGNGKFYGKTEAPKDNILRYVTGSEPRSLDPPVGTGQPEARIYMALFEGLVEYHPKTMEPIPAIAEKWEISKDGTEYLFHLRKNAKFSNGDPITAKDFVYSFRRSLSPELASESATLAYFIKYSEAYNSGAVFVKDANGRFLLKSDLEDGPSTESEAKQDEMPGATEFHKFIDGPERLTLKGDEKGRAKQFESNPKLKELAEGKEFVPVKAEDMGVEAVDEYTFRVKLYQPAPYFLGVLAHQLFRVVHQGTIEKHGKEWVKPEYIVTSGPFKVVEHRPYDTLIVKKDENYWNKDAVKLAGIEFYPLEEQTTMMNLYKAGEVDAIYNHTVPAAWLDELKPKAKDEYLNFPEVASEFYVINIKKPPMDNLKVRQAFALAIDREALARFRKTTKPLADFTPEGIFPKYDEARKNVAARKIKELGIDQKTWDKRYFDPERARKLLAEAGYPVSGSEGNYSCEKFPVDKVNITYNTSESNKATAEFVQAQWKQNLGITVPLKNLEFKTYLPMLNKVEYEGFGRRGWVGDYMDPFTFLDLFYTEGNNGATGWTDKTYDKMLSDANKILDPDKRFEKMAEAEFMLLQQQIVIPLMTQATNWMKKPYVKGFYPNPGTLHAWQFVYIEQDPAKWDTNVDNLMTEKNPATEELLEKLMAPQKELEAKKAEMAKAE